MPKMLNDGAVEYEDGTPATESQVPYVCCELFTVNLTAVRLTMNIGRMKQFFFLLVMFCCRWGKMLCHFCHGQLSLRWKRENWFVSFNILFPPQIK